MDKEDVVAAAKETIQLFDKRASSLSSLEVKITHSLGGDWVYSEEWRSR